MILKFVILGLLPSLSQASDLKYGLSLLKSISFCVRNPGSQSAAMNSSETKCRNLVNVNSKESSVPNYSGSDFYQWLVGLTDNAIRYAPASCLN